MFYVLNIFVYPIQLLKLAGLHFFYLAIHPLFLSLPPAVRLSRECRFLASWDSLSERLNRVYIETPMDQQQLHLQRGHCFVV